MTSTRLAALPLVTLCLVAAGVVGTATPGAGTALEYDRRLVGDGEAARLVTASFTHWTGRMAFWDLLVVGIAGALVERRSRRVAAVTAILAVAGVALVVQAGPPGVEVYRGSSGLATGLFVAAALGLVLDARSHRRRAVGVVAVGLLVAKIVTEATGGAALAAGPLPAGVEVLPLVHVAGGAAGIAGLLASPRRRPRDPGEQRWTSSPSGRS